MNLFLDIETIGSDRADVKSYIASTVKVPGTYKKAESIAKWEAEEKPQAIEEALQKTGLDGAFGQVAVIGYAFDDGPVNTLHSESELVLLKQFYAVLAKTVPFQKWYDLTVVGHNVSGFDLRFLFQRHIVNGLKPHPTLMRAVQAKPWETEKVFDTMVQFAGVGNRISLDKLCMALGVPSPKSEMDGSQVWDYIKQGKVEEVRKYCAADVEATRLIFNRMSFLTQILETEHEPV
jgi:3'-5' exonuclease